MPAGIALLADGVASISLRASLVSLLVAAAACAPASPPPEPAPFSVRGGVIRDAQDRQVILRGVNLSGKHKTAPYFDDHQEEDFRAVRDELGMNTLRFLIVWAAVEPQPDEYDDAYLDEVAKRMQWAKDAGLLVVIDMHQDVFGEGFPGGDGAPRWACDESRYAAFHPSDQWYLSYLDPNVVACFDAFWDSADLQDHYARAFRHVAERLQDAPAVIGFDVMNEPWLGSSTIDGFEPQRLQPFYERVVPEVRKAAPHWLAFLEPSSMANVDRPSTLEPFSFDGVVYAPHSYDSSAESGDAFDPQSRDAVFAKLTRLAGEARGLGAALWVGEYGGVADSGGIAPYMDAEYDAFAGVGAGSAYWDDSKSDGYGLFTADGAEKPALWDAVVRPAPERVAGTLSSWAYDDVARTLTVKIEGATGAASVLAVPARAYPDGFDVTCDVACDIARDTSVDGNRVEVSARAGADVVVTVAPAG